MDKIRKDDGRDDAKVDLNDPNDISYAHSKPASALKSIRNMLRQPVRAAGKPLPNILKNTKNKLNATGKVHVFCRLFITDLIRKQKLHPI